MLERRPRTTKPRSRGARREQLDPDRIAELRDEAAEKLAELEEEIEQLDAALRVSARGLNLPEPVVPEPEIDAEVDGPEPLVDSRWDWVEHTRVLRRSKEYER